MQPQTLGTVVKEEESSHSAVFLVAILELFAAIGDAANRNLEFVSDLRQPGLIVVSSGPLKRLPEPFPVTALFSGRASAECCASVLSP